MNVKLLITCKEATNFISQREEKKLSFMEKIQLLIHLIICEFCKLFYKQNQIIINRVKNLSIDDSLTQEELEKIDRTLEDASN